MNIIALSLGLAPVPPLPREVLERHASRTRELQREHGRQASSGRKHGPTVRAEVRELLRTTGPATLLDIQTYYGWSACNAKAHLSKLAASGEIRIEQRLIAGRWTNIHHYAEPAA